MGLLGWHLGEILKPDDVPLIRGLSSEMTEEGLRDFGAIMNTSGAVSLFHLEGVPPEVKRISDTSLWVTSREKITVTSEDVERVRKKIYGEGRKDKFSIHRLPTFHNTGNNESKSLA